MGAEPAQSLSLRDVLCCHAGICCLLLRPQLRWRLSPPWPLIPYKQWPRPKLNETSRNSCKCDGEEGRPRASQPSKPSLALAAGLTVRNCRRLPQCKLWLVVDQMATLAPRGAACVGVSRRGSLSRAARQTIACAHQPHQEQRGSVPKLAQHTAGLMAAAVLLSTGAQCRRPHNASKMCCWLR